MGVNKQKILDGIFYFGLGSAFAFFVAGSYVGSRFDSSSSEIKSIIEDLNESSTKLVNDASEFLVNIKNENVVQDHFGEISFRSFEEFSKPDINLYENPQIEELSDRIYNEYGLGILVTDDALSKKEDLRWLLSKMKFNLGKIYRPLMEDTRFVFIDTKTHGSHKQDDLLNNFVLASAMGGLRTILLSTNKEYEVEDLAHEFTHIKAYYTDDFNENWFKLITSNGRNLLQEIDDYKKDDKTDFPAFGFTSFYGSTLNHLEDSLGEHTYFKEDAPEYLSSIYQPNSPFRRVESNKEVYVKKLWFLRQNDFISEEQYQQATNEIYKRE